MLPLTPLRSYRLLGPFEEGPQPGRGTNGQGNANGLGEAREAGSTSCLIRPLLGVSRRDIEDYCEEHGLNPRFDRSNLDTTYFRNRVRHELLPELEQYNPRIGARLRHLAAVVAADYELIAEARREAWEGVIREERGDGVVFDQSAWQALPVSLQRATLRHAAYRLRRSLRDVTFTHVENARRVALEGETGKASTLPMGLELRVGYETLTVGDADEAVPPPDEPLLWVNEPLPVSVPGTTPLPETEWILTSHPLDRWSMAEVASPEHPWTAYVDAEAIEKPLVLRPRREGDRMEPLGMGGKHAKVSELMINLKIPEAWRDHVPLLAAGGEILWLCGRRMSERARVDEKTEEVARFRFERSP
jgi:tRNA(Ile)-lysidine synthase